MSGLGDFVDRNAAFELPTHFALAGEYGSTLICFHNFYDQVFPGADVPVDLHLFGFDGAGRETGALAVAVRTGDAVQVPAAELRMTEPGLVAAAAVPRFDLRTLAEGKFKLRKRIGTGYYMIWEDGRGHADTMHEWLALSRAPIARRTSYTVFQHAGGRIARCGVVLLSPTLDASAAGQARIAAFGPSGRRLASAELTRIPAMSARLVLLDELLPGFAGFLAAEGAISVKVESANLAEPLSYEQQVSGDFHIQHF